MSETTRVDTRLATIAESWRKRASELRRYAAAEGAAKAWETAAEELEACAAGSPNDSLDGDLTLAEASRASGYSARHLRRLVDQGRIPNRGRKHAPRFRRGDLPGKNIPLTASSRWTEAQLYDDFGRTLRAIAEEKR